MHNEKDNILIAQRFDELIKISQKRCPEIEEQRGILKAFEFAKEAHKDVKRHSGEPYILHPIEVAIIVVKEIGLGYKSIVTALLHDVVEDTDYSIDDIKRLFGTKIASLVEGLTKVSIAFDASVSEQAENFKRILLTMGDDIRVILIKLADRLHNVRTIQFLPAQKRDKILSETMFIFMPLANRLGLYSIKTEMENVWFSSSYPNEYEEVQEKLSIITAQRGDTIDQFVASISLILSNLGYNYTISKRIKSPYSVWRKMNSKGIPFEQIYDIFALRIVFEPTPEIEERSQCFRIYADITKNYLSKSDRIRDWTNKAKSNGYEALHCTIMGPNGNWIEVQIRTKRMDDIAEHGLAAHWLYKDISLQDSEMEVWLEKVKEVLESPDSNALDFLDRFHTGLLLPDIPVITPKGEMRHIPKGSTVLDFAYSLHSAIGNRAIAAKVNHKLVSLRYQPHMGDRIEILTADTQHPQKEWLTFVQTPKARTAIVEFFKAEVSNSLLKGEQILELKLKELGVPLHDRVINKLLDAFHINSKEGLFSHIGAGFLDLSELQKILKQNKAERKISYWGIIFPKTNSSQSDSITRHSYSLEEDPIAKTLSYSVANCCRPIPGDEVMGFRLSDGEVLVHKKSCPAGMEEATRIGEKIINAEWKQHSYHSFLARVALRGIDRMGILKDITEYLSLKLSINIRKVIIETHDGIFEGHIDLYVHDTEHLDQLIKNINKINGVEFVSRIDVKKD
ncbi:MAG: RelA/SpoT family protein [Prevotellaceae bacterium]|jgi:GTP pyrophosphokinase|nr:RelA/SpoT family protein [Prevotellaceae bacterium]